MLPRCDAENPLLRVQRDEIISNQGTYAHINVCVNVGDVADIRPSFGNRKQMGGMRAGHRRTAEQPAFSTVSKSRLKAQNDSSWPSERSRLGVEARDELLSMLSEPELGCCCSEAALDVTVEEDVEDERVFSLKSVMITVTFPTVMASCWAVLRSTFFNLGLLNRSKATNVIPMYWDVQGSFSFDRIQEITKKNTNAVKFKPWTISDMNTVEHS